MPDSSADTAPANCFDGPTLTGSARAAAFVTGLAATTGFDFVADFCFDECATDFIFFTEGDFDRAIFLFLPFADVGFFGI
jgi:hypothetical protein